jgi:hypothetical protein
MAPLFLAIFLIAFGLNLLLGLSIPIWFLGLLAVTAGVLILIKRFASVPERVPAGEGRTLERTEAKHPAKPDASACDPVVFSD